MRHPEPRRPQFLGGYRDLLGHGTHTRDQRTGNRDHNLMGLFAPCAELPIACAQAHLCLPTDVLDRLGEFFQSKLQMPTDLSRVARGPGAFDQGTTGMGLTGLGDAPLTAPLSRRVFRSY